MEGNMSNETKTIQSIKRRNSSVYGNPRFRFTFTDGDIADSMSDAGFAYGVGNQDMREGSTVLVEYTGAGNIRSMRAI